MCQGPEVGKILQRTDLCDWSFMEKERVTEEAYGEGRSRITLCLLLWVLFSGNWEAFGGL